ncbi:unnamed protein product, partial [Tilletia controversa]
YVELAVLLPLPVWQGHFSPPGSSRTSWA